MLRTKCPLQYLPNFSIINTMRRVQIHKRETFGCFTLFFMVFSFLFSPYFYFYRNINSYSAREDRRVCRELRRGRKVGESVIPQIKQANKHPLEVFLQICQEKKQRGDQKEKEKRKKRSAFVTPSDKLVNLWQALHVSI